MRYFRYQNTNKNIDIALKERYKSLSKNEQRTVRQKEAWRSFSMVVTVIAFSLITFPGFYLIASIPSPSGWWWKLPVIVAKLLLSCVFFVTGCFLTYILTRSLWKKVNSFNLPPMKKEIFSKACVHLRNYYKLQEPYIITKCFDATDKKFKNHDVCIFVVRDELRITSNLIRGFLHGERDLGCYAFKQNEITLSKQQNGKYLIAELKADNNVFLLGYRAKGFIEKNFTEKE